MVSRVRFGSLVFGPRLAASQLIEANISDNAVEPSVKAAFEAKAVQIAVDLEESFLVYVPCVFRPLHQIECQTKHIPVVAVDKLLESRAVPGLRFDHKGALVQVGQTVHRSQGGAGATRQACIISQS